MRKFLRKAGALILAALLLCNALPQKAEAGYETPGFCQVQADNGAVYTVKTLDYDYANNTYLSLRDLAVALQNTDKAFSLEIKRNSVSLNPGSSYQPVGGENISWREGENPDVTLKRNDFLVGGQSVYYYSMIAKMPSGAYDCFIMAADLAMILDMKLTVPGADFLQIDTGEPFSVSPAALERDGYFYGVNGVLVGDVVTGEVYYRYQSDIPFPIASTSKLMTCLLTLEAVSAGQLTLEETATVSEAAQALSATGDGVIPLEAGAEIPVRELLTAALLPSSNECALCLAEKLAGSEEAFVEKMNGKAAELGLSQAAFFNSNGLPIYTEESVPSKRQNRMSAEDMFRMVSYLLKVYPQIKDITSQKTAVLETLNREVRNTNPLLHNLSVVTGLKTGTTNKAGACLVTSLAADDGTMEHDLVVIVLGTENSVERGRVSELLARYALQAFFEGREVEDGSVNRTEGGLPAHAEAAVDLVLQTARRR
ncbi:MAG: serine hydrolase [Roseburia sp.]|nr:serine hydrolase [Roseburia sp.]MCM1099659.1 serine hydrolase [Ruminococcus flavefaciens]